MGIIKSLKYNRLKVLTEHFTQKKPSINDRAWLLVTLIVSEEVPNRFFANRSEVKLRLAQAPILHQAFALQALFGFAPDAAARHSERAKTWQHKVSPTQSPPAVVWLQQWGIDHGAMDFDARPIAMPVSITILAIISGDA